MYKCGQLAVNSVSSCKLGECAKQIWTLSFKVNACSFCISTLQLPSIEMDAYKWEIQRP